MSTLTQFLKKLNCSIKTFLQLFHIHVAKIHVTDPLRSFCPTKTFAVVLLSYCKWCLVTMTYAVDLFGKKQICQNGLRQATMSKSLHVHVKEKLVTICYSYSRPPLQLQNQQSSISCALIRNLIIKITSIVTTVFVHIAIFQHMLMELIHPNIPQILFFCKYESLLDGDSFNIQ